MELNNSRDPKDAGTVLIDPQGDAALIKRMFEACRSAGKDDSVLVVQPAKAAPLTGKAAMISQVKFDRIRFALVAIGLFIAQLLFSFRPNGDINGDVPLFPTAFGWMTFMVGSWAAVSIGMFTRGKSRWPLYIGVVGTGFLVLRALGN